MKQVSLRQAQPPQVAVVIPCYRVAAQIQRVIRGIPAWVQTIVCVDDCSPDATVACITELNDPRVVLVRHERNQGVGGAVLTGYAVSRERGARIIVKMDGDDQMDPAQLLELIAPLVKLQADYAKGNRWFDQQQLQSMPIARQFGNLGLSFLTKVASGYWQIFDPCNGYTAIRTEALARLDTRRIARDYYFETSMLVELNIAGAVVRDVPIPARYQDEHSSLRIGRILRRFPLALFCSFWRRLWQRHFVHDFSACAVLLTAAFPLLLWGLLFGGWRWWQSVQAGVPASAGTVMLAALPLLMGFQLLVQAAVIDMTHCPRRPLCRQATRVKREAPGRTDGKRAA